MLGAAARLHQWSGFYLRGAVAAMLPDLDVAALRFGVRYQVAFGPRGAAQSIVFALAIAALAALTHPLVKSTAWRSAISVGLVALSHPLLDMRTTDGAGVALLWSFSEHRRFHPQH